MMPGWRQYSVVQWHDLSRWPCGLRLHSLVVGTADSQQNEIAAFCTDAAFLDQKNDKGGDLACAASMSSMPLIMLQLGTPQPRNRASTARVTGSATSVPSPCSAGSSWLASCLPSSTPNWSKALMPQITDCT